MDVKIDVKRKLILLFLVLLLITSCNTNQTTIDSKDSDQSDITEVEEINPRDEIDLSLNPNEAGKIMVLMYHNIGQEEQEWVRTPENFRKDLLTLYEKGYRPISLKDYVTGNIDTPQGYTPIVITFDDGNRNNFNYLEDHSLDKDCAVGILLDFHQKYPDFPLEATFFLDGNVPFDQIGFEVEKVNFLIENGMDIGNHTKTHANFTNITKDKLQEEIGSQADYLKQLIKDKDYNIDTLALPFGTRPKDDSLSNYLEEGTYEENSYKNIAILNVGWNPGRSPYDKKFNFESIPRIRASETKVDNVGLYNYLEYFDANPQEKFISDGFADVVTIPEGRLEDIITDISKDVYTYKKDEIRKVTN